MSNEITEPITDLAATIHGDHNLTCYMGRTVILGASSGVYHFYLPSGSPLAGFPSEVDT